MNSKFALIPLCIAAFLSGCESAQSITPPSSSLPPPVSINDACPEGTSARVVSDMRNMSTIECVYEKLLADGRRVQVVVDGANRVASIPVK